MYRADVQNGRNDAKLNECELTKQRDDALKDNRLLTQQAVSGARGLVDLQSIGKAVKRAGYEVCDAEDE